MAAGAQGGVDEYGAIAVGAASRQRGRQKLDAAVEQDGNVAVGARGVVVFGHRIASGGGPCTEVPVRGRGPGVGEVRQGRFGQRPRCMGNVPGFYAAIR